MKSPEKMVTIAENMSKVKASGLKDAIAGDIKTTANVRIPNASIKSKLQSVADGVKNTYESGVASAEKYKRNISGSTIAVNDVNSIEHVLNVSVKSKNLFDYTNLGTKYSGLAEATLEENILKVEHNLNYSTGYMSANYTIPHSKDLAGKTITISAQAKTGTDVGQAMIRILYVKPNGSAIVGYTDIYCHTKSTEFTTITATGVIKADIPEEDCELCVLFYSNAGGNASTSGVSYYKDVQIEIGSTATPYTPYRAGVEVSRYGKNLFNTENKSSSYSSTIEIIDTNNCIITAQRVIYTCYWGFYIENPKKDFTISFKYLTENTPVLSAGRVNCIYVYGSNRYNYDSTAKYITSTDTKATDGVQRDYIFKISAASCVGYKYIYIWWYGYNTSLSEIPENPYRVILSDIQVELGSTATEYEPYKEPQTATANSEGVVEGLKSLSPNMTLMSDTEGVIIDCEYYSNTSK